MGGAEVSCLCDDCLKEFALCVYMWCVMCYVCVQVCASVCMCMFTYVWVHKETKSWCWISYSIISHLIIFFSDKVFYKTWSSTNLARLADWWALGMLLPVLPTQWNTSCLMLSPAFYVSVENLNLGLGGCTASSLSTKPSSKPRCLHF